MPERRRLLILTLIREPGVEASQVEDKLDKAVDWFRYQKDCYVLLSTTTAVAWTKLLDPLVSQMLIGVIDPAVSDGLMNERFWKWFNAAWKRVT